MDIINRIALKIAREYFADEQATKDIYDLRINKNIVNLIMSKFKESNKSFFDFDYDIKEQLQKILDYYNIQQNYQKLNNTKIKIIFLPKSKDIFSNEATITKEQAKKYINFWLPGDCTGRTTEYPSLMCIIASIVQLNNVAYKRNDRAIAKTLRHELEHACQMILGLQDEQVKELNENRDSQYFQIFTDFSKKRQIGRYTNDMKEDIQDYNLDVDFFFNFAEEHYFDDIDIIFQDVNSAATQFLKQFQNDNNITNQDIANNLLFLCSLKRYNENKYQAIKRTFY